MLYYCHYMYYFLLVFLLSCGVPACKLACIANYKSSSMLNKLHNIYKSSSLLTF